MRYYAVPESHDGCELPTSPEPMELPELAQQLVHLVSAYQRQGYFSNAKQERIPVSELCFRLIPENA